MTAILVSYRRDASAPGARRLADALAAACGATAVLHDREVPAGSDFSDVLHRAIDAAAALLVVIGRDWVSAADGPAGRGAWAATDAVRTQIEAAFAQGKPVIPVLLDGAELPTAEILPQSIRRLADARPARVTRRGWDTEVGQLVERLRGLCARAGDTAAPRLAGVLRELDACIANEAAPRRRPHIVPPRMPPTTTQRALRGLRRPLAGLLAVTVVAGLLYLGLRWFGDEATRHALDTAEARLSVAWQGLKGRLAPPR